MKKLFLALAAFVVMGGVANAQTPETIYNDEQTRFAVDHSGNANTYRLYVNNTRVPNVATIGSGMVTFVLPPANTSGVPNGTYNMLVAAVYIVDGVEQEFRSPGLSVIITDRPNVPTRTAPTNDRILRP